MVRFVNCIIEYGDKGCLHVLQRAAAILLDLPPLLGDALFDVCERARWDIEECAYIRCVNSLLRGLRVVFRPGNDIAGVYIQWMVIILDSLGASDDLGLDLLEAAEKRVSCNFVNRTNGMSNILWCIFHHAGFRAGYVLVRPGGDTRPIFRIVVLYS